MLDYYDFETTPSEVAPQMLGPNYDPIKARQEALKTILTVIKTVGEPPAGSRFKVASNPHDFGSYYSIRYCYSPDSEEHLHYLENVESNWPEQY